MKINISVLVCALVGSASSFEDDYFDDNIAMVGFDNHFDDFIVNIADEQKDLNFMDDELKNMLKASEDLKKLAD